MSRVWFITHPDVEIDPAIPVPDWRLNRRGIARLRAMLPRAAGVAAVACSAERKAIDGAKILAEHLGLTPMIRSDLGENDRSATGFLPKAEFEAVANEFFARPGENIRGWERAIDAQSRIVTAVKGVLADVPAGDIAIVSHGGVGALLLCHLQKIPITRAADQPPGSGGYYLEFDRSTWSPRHDWRPIDG